LSLHVHELPSLVPCLPQLDVSPEQESELRVMAHALLGHRANLNADRASA